MQFSAKQKLKIDKIFKKYAVKFAYAFGSFVTGNYIESSDIDIAVFLELPDAAKERFEVRLKLMSELGKILNREIDLVIINDISSIFFKYVIFKEGHIIFEADRDFRIDTECRTYSEYFDFQPFLELYNKNFLNKKIYA